MKGGKAYKPIRGMGSRSAMEARSGSRSRYHQQNPKHTTDTLTTAQKQKMVPEGVEGLVPLKGSVESVMTEFCGGVQAGLAHSGAPDLPTFRENARLWVQSMAGVLEGRPHDLSDIHH
jgi:IMP dehydrogenase